MMPVAYMRSPSHKVHHLAVVATYQESSFVSRHWVPLCAMNNGRPWKFVSEPDGGPLCSRCLSELDKLNEAATAVGR